MISPGKNKLESLFSNFSKIDRRNLKKIDQLFQVAIHFHPNHPQTKMIDTSFCALVWLFLTKLNHYFNVPMDTNMFFSLFKVTLKIGDSAPLICRG